MAKKRFLEKLYDKTGILVLLLPLLLVPLLYVGISYFVSPLHIVELRNTKNFLLFFLPLVLLYVIHDRVLIRMLYMRKHIAWYVISVAVLLGAYYGQAYWRFEYLHEPPELRGVKPPHHRGEGPGHHGFGPPPHDKGEDRDHKNPPPDHKDKPHKKPHHKKGKPGPNPLAVDMILALLLISSDFSVNMFLNYSREKKRNEALENKRLQNELQYLKAQINPHFLMNTLNNIHGMVEINPQKAQEMVMELSKLMRYVLYEGERSFTTLKTEVEFIENYVALMRKRYSSRKVDIKIEMPDSELYGIKLPPLLFMVAIENAFKHGISYRNHSELEISINILPKHKLHFMCRNSKWNKKESNSDKKYSGIGLKNLYKRLDLLYGSNYVLEIDDAEKTYTVNFTIPYEYEDNNKVSGS